eukprot:349854_1
MSSSFVINQILNSVIESAMNISQKHVLHFKVSPMHELLPHDILQYMIGFNEDLRNVALVNKTFHRCSRSEQRLFLRQQQTDWEREFNDNCLIDFAKGRIINVYSSPRRNTLSLATQHARSGDTLVIHQGVYPFRFADPRFSDYDSLYLDMYPDVFKSIKLIRYDSNVVIEGDRAAFKFSAQYTYLRNIRFEVQPSPHNHCIGIEVQSSYLFYMENCVILSHKLCHALVILSRGTVKIKNCLIKGCESNQMAVRCSYHPEVLEIESCIIEDCCRVSDIYIHD